MTAIAVRDAGPGDLPGIAAVARATGQGEEWSGADPAYVNHLLRHGRVVVAASGDSVAGFGATRLIGGAEPVSMLCDLFVDPRAHGRGYGRAMLSLLWADGGRGPRMTFSSQHAHALPLYTSAGLDAWWPLLYLRGNVAAAPAPAGWRVRPAAPDEVAALELSWTGADRGADHRAWAARPAGASLLALRDDEAVAAGTAGGAGGGYGLTHLALAPSAGHADAAGAVLAVLAALTPSDGRASVCLPAPHPAVRPLLAAGWRITGHDLFMATGRGLIGCERAVPSPALA